MAWHQEDVPTAATHIESVLALEAQMAAAVADTEAELPWRTVMDRARALRHAMVWGESDQVERLIESLKEALNQAGLPGN